MTLKTNLCVICDKEMMSEYELDSHLILEHLSFIIKLFKLTKADALKPLIINVKQIESFPVPVPIKDEPNDQLVPYSTKESTVLEMETPNLPKLLDMPNLNGINAYDQPSVFDPKILPDVAAPEVQQNKLAVTALEAKQNDDAFPMPIKEEPNDELVPYSPKKKSVKNKAICNRSKPPLAAIKQSPSLTYSVQENKFEVSLFEIVLFPEPPSTEIGRFFPELGACNSFRSIKSELSSTGRNSTLNINCSNISIKAEPTKHSFNNKIGRPAQKCITKTSKKRPRSVSETGGNLRKKAKDPLSHDTPELGPNPKLTQDQDPLNNAPATFTCKTCDKKFNSKYKLARHRKRDHPATGQVKCLECKSYFDTKDDFVKHCQAAHKETVNKTNRFVDLVRQYNGVKMGRGRPRKLGPVPNCTKCDKSFRTTSLLNQHEKLVHAPASHQCPKCGKAFKTKYTMRDHFIIYHTNADQTKPKSKASNSPVKAEPKKIKIENNVSAIAPKVNSKSDPPKFRCSKCSKCFLSKILLKSHEKGIHGNYQMDHPLGSTKTVKGSIKLEYSKRTIQVINVQ